MEDAWHRMAEEREIKAPSEAGEQMWLGWGLSTMCRRVPCAALFTIHLSLFVREPKPRKEDLPDGWH